MCQKLEIARDQVYCLKITRDKARDAFSTPILGITTLVRDPREHLYNAQRTVPDYVRSGVRIYRYNTVTTTVLTPLPGAVTTL